MKTLNLSFTVTTILLLGIANHPELISKIPSKRKVLWLNTWFNHSIWSFEESPGPGCWWVRQNTRQLSLQRSLPLRVLTRPLLEDATLPGRQIFSQKQASTLPTSSFDGKARSNSFTPPVVHSKPLKNSSLETSRLKPVLVAVVDTGVDTEHTALKSSIWSNPGESGLDTHGREKQTNGIDDDRNGFIDDVHGWNFAENSANILDQHGHGTHIAGIIAAKKTDQNEYQGASANARIMVLKYYGKNQSGFDQLKATVAAFAYATKMGAQIINYSAGGSSANPSEYSVIEQARRKNVLLISAAGNQGLNADIHPYYPASYDLDNILAVGGLSAKGQLFESSNYGESNIDVTALGENVLSTLPGGGYGFMSGTSQATAFLTGFAAVLLGMPSPPKTPEQLKTRLIYTGRQLLNLRNKIKSSRQAELTAAMFSRGRSHVHPLSETYKSSWSQLTTGLKLKGGAVNRAPSTQPSTSDN